MSTQPPRQSRLCPCCKSVLMVRRWKLDAQLYGEIRECPDKARCSYSSSWKVNEKVSPGEITGVTFMRSSAIQQKRQRENTPSGMVPGGDA